jgi:hypothetical protein
LQFLPSLTSHRGELLSAQLDRGCPVYAATFLPARRIVLDRDLLEDPPLLRLILTHELLHFAWLRLGNARRREYQELLAFECARRARGELGESAGVAKEKVNESDWRSASPAWRYYACESFCDTGACLLGGVTHHPWFQLAKRWRERRAAWFKTLPYLRV